MLKARKRLDKLEGSLLPKSAAAPGDTVFRKTLRHLSIADLNILIPIAEDNERGTPRTQFTEPELSALAAYGTALDQELQLAGIGSMAEFAKLRGRRR